MNPANFQNMAGQGMVPQGAQHQAAQQRGATMNQQIAQRIFQALQALQQQQQQNLQGWQVSFQLSQRVPVVLQLFVTDPIPMKPRYIQADRKQGHVPADDQGRDARRTGDKCCSAIRTQNILRLS